MTCKDKNTKSQPKKTVYETVNFEQQNGTTFKKNTFIILLYFILICKKLTFS